MNCVNIRMHGATIKIEISINSGYVTLGMKVMSQRMLSSVSFCYGTVTH